jgi:hypothetical protein
MLSIYAIYALCALLSALLCVQTSNPTQWTAAILGQPPTAYSAWILDPKHWGGAIELAILSQYYAVEIAALQIETTKLYVYSEGQYKQRVYLVYTGIHYDVLVSAAAAAVSGGAEQEAKSGGGSATVSSDVVRFASDDALALAQIMSLATQWQQVFCAAFFVVVVVWFEACFELEQ